VRGDLLGDHHLKGDLLGGHHMRVNLWQGLYGDLRDPWNLQMSDIRGNAILVAVQVPQRGALKRKTLCSKAISRPVPCQRKISLSRRSLMRPWRQIR